MKRLLLIAAIFALTAQTGPIFNASQVYEIGTCSSTTTTCAVTLKSTYPSGIACQVEDKSTPNPINLACSISGSTLTISTEATPYANACSMSAATTCTFTAPFSGTFNCVAENISATTSSASCAISSTTVTVTASASNSNTWHVVGMFINPAPSSAHTYVYTVFQ